MPRRIPLTQGKFAIVDDTDFEWLSGWKWYALKSSNTFYAVRSEPWQDGKRKQLRMHRLIVDPPVGKELDHANGDGLDNRRSNLRICTRRQNHMNRRKGIGWSSRYKGVTWNVHAQNWQAQIKLHNVKHYLGHFDNELDAAQAYDSAARELFGEFARLNLEATGASEA